MKLITDHKNNAFNLARLLASIMVVYGHSLSVGPGLNPLSDILYRATGVFSASLAVKFFFLLSGMLVTTSLLKSGNWVVFLRHRAFRIYPGLICALFFVILIVGPLGSPLNYIDFVGSKSTFTYLFRNLTFSTFGADMSLPSVAISKWTNMNIPLWTLAPEVTCYIFMLSAFILTLRNRVAFTFFALMVIVDCLLPTRFLLTFLPVGDDNFSFLPLFFAVGALLAIYRELLSISIVFPLIFLFLFYLYSGTYIGVVSKYLVLIFVMLYLFTRPLICKLEIKNDFSYGIYIYGWPCQMIILHYFSNINGYIHFFFPLALCSLMALISWFYIERPFINVGKNFHLLWYSNLKDRFNKHTI